MYLSVDSVRFIYIINYFDCIFLVFSIAKHLFFSRFCTVRTTTRCRCFHLISFHKIINICHMHFLIYSLIYFFLFSSFRSISSHLYSCPFYFRFGNIRGHLLFTFYLHFPFYVAFELIFRPVFLSVLKKRET